jgi:hypothetical protein
MAEHTDTRSVADYDARYVLRREGSGFHVRAPTGARGRLAERIELLAKLTIATRAEAA